MIKVVRNKVKEMAVEDLTDSHFIGVQFNNCEKGAVVRLDDNEYVIVSLENWGDYDSLAIWNTLQELTTSTDIKECYVFESGKELFNWVANG